MEIEEIERIKREIIDLKLKRQTQEVKLKIQKLQQKLDEVV